MLKLIGKINFAAPKQVKPPKIDYEEMTPEKPKKRLSGDYTEEFDPVRIPIDNFRDINISVKRQGDMGLPHLEMKTWAHTELYTGPTKQGFSVPVEKIRDLIEALEEVERKCHRKELMYFEE